MAKAISPAQMKDNSNFGYFGDNRRVVGGAGRADGMDADAGFGPDQHQAQDVNGAGAKDEKLGDGEGGQSCSDGGGLQRGDAVSGA